MCPMTRYAIKCLCSIVGLLWMVGIPHALAQTGASLDSIVTESTYKIRYERLDRIQNTQSPFLSSEKREIYFDLVELTNLGTKESLRGVEVLVSTKERQVLAQSLGFSQLGSLWGTNSSTIFQNIRKKGYILLRKEDLIEITGFLNEVISETGRAQERMLLYKIALGKFELGMFHDPDLEATKGEQPGRAEANPWRFVVTVGEATYTMDYRDGVEVLQGLARFEERL